MEQSQKGTQEKLQSYEEDIVTINECQCDICTKLNSLISEYDSSKHKWTLKIHDYAMRITKLQDELGNRQRDIVKLLTVNDELSSKVNDLENTIEEMQQEKRSFKNYLRKLETDKERIQSELKQTNNVFNDVMRTVGTLNWMLFDEKLNESYDLITKLPDIASRVMILKEENHELKNKLKLYEKELETTKKAKEDSEGNFRQRMEESAQTESKLYKDKAVSAYMKQEYQLSTIKWQRLENKIAEFLKLNAKLSREIDTLKGSNLVLLGKRLDVQTEINFLNNKLREETRSKTEMQVNLLTRELRLQGRQEFLEDSLTEKLQTISELKTAYKTQTALLEQSECRVNEFEELNSEQSHTIATLKETLQQDRDRSTKIASTLMSQIQREQRERTALMTSFQEMANKMIGATTEKLQAEIRRKALDDVCVKLRIQLQDQSITQEAYNGTLIHITSVLENCIHLNNLDDENMFAFQTPENELDTNIGQLKTTLNRLLINMARYKQSASTDKSQLRESKPNNSENDQILQSLASQKDVLIAANNKFRKTQDLNSKRIKILGKALADSQLHCSEIKKENDKLIEALKTSDSLAGKLQEEINKHNLKSAEFSKQELRVKLLNPKSEFEKRRKSNEEKIKDLSLELGKSESTNVRLYQEIGAANLEIAEMKKTHNEQLLKVTMQHEQASIALTQEKEKVKSFESLVKKLKKSYEEKLRNANKSHSAMETSLRTLYLEIGETNLGVRTMKGRLTKLRKERDDALNCFNTVEKMSNLTSDNGEKSEAQSGVFQFGMNLLEKGTDDQKLSAVKAIVGAEQKNHILHRENNQEIRHIKEESAERAL